MKSGEKGWLITSEKLRFLSGPCLSLTHTSLDFYLYEDFHGHDAFPSSLFEPKPQKRATKDIICAHPEDCTSFLDFADATMGNSINLTQMPNWFIIYFLVRSFFFIQLCFEASAFKNWSTLNMGVLFWKCIGHFICAGQEDWLCVVLLHLAKIESIHYFGRNRTVVE